MYYRSPLISLRFFGQLCLILLEEGSRRLRCCAPTLSWATKATVLTVFCIQMMESGHKVAFRDMIISRVVAKYLNPLARHRAAIQPLYRTKVEREASRSEARPRRRIIRNSSDKS